MAHIYSHASPRAVDHLVLPVMDLDGARSRLEALGFTVAANGYHPFGTVNACVFLADKTYLEPLAIADPVAVDAAMDAGNAFIARDRLFRQHRQEGLSAIVVQSDDAKADHDAFTAAGISGGDMFEFSRPVRLPDGREITSSFRLAFAVDEAEEQFFAFACQRLNPLPADRQALERHANGALGLKRLLIQSARHESQATWMQVVLGADGTPITNGTTYEMQNLRVEVTESDFAEDSLLAFALVFTVADLEVTAAALTANGVVYQKLSGGITVPAAPGQGVAFLFEENAS